MSAELKEKAQDAMKKMFFCGAVCAASTMGSVASFVELVKDVKQDAPEQIVGDDGHGGIKLSPSQSLKFSGAVAGGTIAIGAAVFGLYLKKEQEKKQQAMQAALMAAKQNTK